MDEDKELKKIELTDQDINQRKNSVPDQLAEPVQLENTVALKGELKIKFKHLGDSSFGDGEKNNTIENAEKLYSIKVTEVDTDPDTTIHYGTSDDICKSIRAISPEDYRENGEVFLNDPTPISITQAIHIAGFATGAAKGVTSQKGKAKYVFISENPKINGKIERVSEEQRIKTTVHELGHVLGLDHPLNKEENIMQQARFEGNLQKLKTNQEQKEIVNTNMEQRGLRR